MKKSMTVEEKEKKKASDARLKAAMKERRDKLFEGDPISHMNKMIEMKNELSSYYYFGSELWRAIRDYIAKAEDCVLMELEGVIISHRGTGPSITMSEAIAYGIGYDKNDTIWMTVEIEYFCDGEEGSYDPNTFEKSYSVYPPCELERKFTKKGFNAWIAEVKEKRDKHTLERDISEYNRLKKKLNNRVS